LNANTEEDRLAIEALDATLDIFNTNGKGLILGLLQKQVGLPLVLDKDVDIPKNEIELALIEILGPDVSRLLIQEWNGKIMKAKKLLEK
jgi:hypothetical protein